MQIVLCFKADCTTSDDRAAIIFAMNYNRHVRFILSSCFKSVLLCRLLAVLSKKTIPFAQFIFKTNKNKIVN